ncbi:MAG TPA: tRNA pseudouridine(38-40) synthase TruA [Candidatus Stercorousia faecigallinarum]|nr:tRNA pseudouridine(38-40) synthase TruA [Candidatus Stercorousia faecigallinarum]
MRYTLQVQYIGKNYAGSQIQFENGIEIQTPTIQGELEKAISTLIFGDTENNNRQLKTVFSGRTDRGVNSKGQVVHFDTDKPIVASKFVYQLNEILPKDISVSDLKQVDASFHAQKSAKRRFYRYVFINRKCKNAFDGDLMRIKYDINIERMQNALNYLLGEHDFSSFKSSGTLNPSKVCFIEKAECKKDDDKVIIDIAGNRFLYNMVRTIVGTLLEIEGHNRSAEYMKQVLEACDRKKAGQTVSPYGLTLIKVEY